MFYIFRLYVQKINMYIYIYICIYIYLYVQREREREKEIVVSYMLISVVNIRDGWTRQLDERVRGDA